MNQYQIDRISTQFRKSLGIFSFHLGQFLFFNKSFLMLPNGLDYEVLMVRFIQRGVVSIVDVLIDDIKIKNIKYFAVVIGSIYVYYLIFLTTAYNNLYMRLTDIVYILGCLFGNKIDSKVWWIIFIVYVILIGYYEQLNNYEIIDLLFYTTNWYINLFVFIFFIISRGIYERITEIGQYLGSFQAITGIIMCFFQLPLFQVMYCHHSILSFN